MSVPPSYFLGFHTPLKMMVEFNFSYITKKLLSLLQAPPMTTRMYNNKDKNKESFTNILPKYPTRIRINVIFIMPSNNL